MGELYVLEKSLRSHAPQYIFCISYDIAINKKIMVYHEKHPKVFPVAMVQSAKYNIYERCAILTPSRKPWSIPPTVNVSYLHTYTVDLNSIVRPLTGHCKIICFIFYLYFIM